ANLRVSIVRIPPSAGNDVFLRPVGNRVAHRGRDAARRRRESMKCTLVGSRYFGASVFEALVKDGVDVAQVVAPAADDRLALAAQAAGVPVHVLGNPKSVP